MAAAAADAATSHAHASPSPFIGDKERGIDICMCRTVLVLLFHVISLVLMLLMMMTRDSWLMPVVRRQTTAIAVVMINTSIYTDAEDVDHIPCPIFFMPSFTLGAKRHS